MAERSAFCSFELFIRCSGRFPEETDAGYKNICEIGKERIRRAGAKIKSETGADIDYGFRVLKLDDTNMQDIFYTPAETDQQMLLGFESNIKPDRTDLDLLFGCLLDWGSAAFHAVQLRADRGRDSAYLQ